MAESELEIFNRQLGEIIDVKTTSPKRASVKFYYLPFPPETYSYSEGFPPKFGEIPRTPVVKEFDGVETVDYTVDPLTHVVETRYCCNRKPDSQYDFQRDVKRRIRIVQRPRDYASAMQTVGAHTTNPFTKFEPVVRWVLGLVLNDNNS